MAPTFGELPPVAAAAVVPTAVDVDADVTGTVEATVVAAEVVSVVSDVLEPVVIATVVVSAVDDSTTLTPAVVAPISVGGVPLPEVSEAIRAVAVSLELPEEEI